MFARIIIPSALLVISSTSHESRSTEIPVPAAKPDEIHNLRKLLPKECGLKHRRNRITRIAHGNLTNPYDYPWIVGLIYENKTSGRLRLQCGGSLITDQYVLTAAHCLNKYSEEGSQLLYVRLGEWNISSQVDCTEDGCRPDHIDVPIGEEIPHEEYELGEDQDRNYSDIGLLKLARRVNFTDEVQPICLPETPNIPDNMTVAGWGLTERMKQSVVLMDASVPHVDLEECRAVATAPEHNVTICPDQICAGGDLNQDACPGDSGGPLMTTSEDDDQVSRATVLGIISEGLNSKCPSRQPALYTKVYNHIPWILSEINETFASESGGESKDAKANEGTS